MAEMELEYEVTCVNIHRRIDRETKLMGANSANQRKNSVRSVELTPVEPERPRDGGIGWRTAPIMIDVRDKELAKRLELGATVTLRIEG